MSEFTCKAVIYKDMEDVYGPCGCGMNLATFPVLLPRSWIMEDRPYEVEDHEFCKGFDYRRVSGFSCSQVFDHEMDGEEFVANFSCCSECALRAVQCGYAIWSDKSYPITMR